MTAPRINILLFLLLLLTSKKRLAAGRKFGGGAELSHETENKLEGESLPEARTGQGNLTDLQSEVETPDMCSNYEAKELCNEDACCYWSSEGQPEVTLRIIFDSILVLVWTNPRFLRSKNMQNKWRFWQKSSTLWNQVHVSDQLR